MQILSFWKHGFQVFKYLGIKIPGFMYNLYISWSYYIDVFAIQQIV